jgi:hypothetical protein
MVDAIVAATAQLGKRVFVGLLRIAGWVGKFDQVVRRALGPNSPVILGKTAPESAAPMFANR